MDTKQSTDTQYIAKNVCRDFMKPNRACKRDDCRYIHDEQLCIRYYKNCMNNGAGACKYKEHCRKHHYLTVPEGFGNRAARNTTTRNKRVKNTRSFDPVRNN
jgi:hypothetical protein